MNRTLTSRSVNFDPTTGGVQYTTPSRAIILATGDGPPGSVFISVDAENDGQEYKIGMNYVAADPKAGTPSEVFFYDTRHMQAGQMHLPEDSPQSKEAFDELLSDVTVVQQAVAEYEAVKAAEAASGQVKNPS
ncbi:MAG TPA: hypothetical protein VFB59_03190 [Candidatus Saccharimonadales bacterium]|nr:hypothetical protein [Candidatus Saccharimonadales bacterium]